MAIHVYTSRPNALLRAIREAVREGRIETWSCDRDGDFTHATPQWRNRAWLCPSVEAERQVMFHVLPPRGAAVSRLVYGVYHGRFVEMLLVHFDGQFDRVTSSSMPEARDRIS
jgi:hypothetical protein